MIGLGSDKNNLALALGGEVLQWSAVAEVKNVGTALTNRSG